MEACAGAHLWGRATRELGHEVRLIPPIHVTLFVKRQKNDAGDVEAIAEAAVRRHMRFVERWSQHKLGNALRVFGIRAFSLVVR